VPRWTRLPLLTLLTLIGLLVLALQVGALPVLAAEWAREAPEFGFLAVPLAVAAVGAVAAVLTVAGLEAVVAVETVVPASSVLRPSCGPRAGRARGNAPPAS